MLAACVPFELYGSHMHASAKGILRLEQEDLVLDLITWNPWTWTKSPPKEIRIPLRNVDALALEKHWFLLHVWLRLRVRKLEYLVGVPTADGAEIILWCKRRYKTLAQEVANAVTFQLLDRIFTDDKNTVPGHYTT